MSTGACSHKLRRAWKCSFTCGTVEKTVSLSRGCASGALPLAASMLQIAEASSRKGCVGVGGRRMLLPVVTFPMTAPKVHKALLLPNHGRAPRREGCRLRRCRRHPRFQTQAACSSLLGRNVWSRAAGISRGRRDATDKAWAALQAACGCSALKLVVLWFASAERLAALRHFRLVLVCARAVTANVLDRLHDRAHVNGVG
mmetsp:Transcript_22001/g.38971  ORF Transcript_22001/g.38971 Transcript_22001/m.38971 type:complete len:200 (+) Transcript_22001:1710-2309(+)